MRVNLDREDLLYLLKGISPNYSAMEHPMIKRYGSLTGFPNERWQWSIPALAGVEDETLWRMYITCKESWR